MEDRRARAAGTYDEDGLADDFVLDLRVLLVAVRDHEARFEIEEEIRAREDSPAEVELGFVLDRIDQHAKMLEPAVVSEVVETSVVRASVRQGSLVEGYDALDVRCSPSRQSRDPLGAGAGFQSVRRS